MSWEPIPQPAILLVRPQMGENIGMCARAMLNCGLTEMRIVAPRDGWPNPAAVATAAGADQIIENARVFDTLAEASADLHHLIATTNRPRFMVKTLHSPDGAVLFSRDAVARGEKVAIVFGPERTGLESTDVAACHSVLTIPLNPGFSSLNLAQAVLIVSYEWAKLTRFSDMPAEEDYLGESPLATQKELNYFLNKLDQLLDEHRFYRTHEMRPPIWENIKNIFTKRSLTSQQLQTLHGMLTSLTTPKS